MISSSLCRNVERSRFSNWAGPPVISPDSLSSAISVRVAIASPIVSSVNTRPLGLNTLAPNSRQRAAKRMSSVTTISAGPASWTIRSSAASSLPSFSTTINSIQGSLGTRCHLSETSTTSNSQRLATRYTSSLTGQESASTKILTGEARPLERADTRQGLT